MYSFNMSGKNSFRIFFLPQLGLLFTHLFTPALPSHYSVHVLPLKQVKPANCMFRGMLYRIDEFMDIYGWVVSLWLTRERVREPMPSIPIWEHGQFCTLGSRSTDASGIIRILTHNLLLNHTGTSSRFLNVWLKSWQCWWSTRNWLMIGDQWGSLM